MREIEAELLRRGEWNGHLKKVRRDGSSIWAASRWALYQDGAGRPHSVIEVNTDVTALKSAEEALRQSEKRYRLAECATNDGLWD